MLFDSQLESAGRQYTRTFALLAVAFLFSPAVLAASRPLGYVSVSLAVVCSAMCVTLALFNWKKFSVPALAIPGAELK